MRYAMQQVMYLWVLLLFLALLHMLWGISHIHEGFLGRGGEDSSPARPTRSQFRPSDTDAPVKPTLVKPTLPTVKHIEDHQTNDRPRLTSTHKTTFASPSPSPSKSHELPEDEELDMLAAMPSLTRIDNPDYLERTLNSIAFEAEAAYKTAVNEQSKPWRIHVLVFKPNSEEHSRFNNSRVRWMSEESRSNSLRFGLSWSFVDNGESRFLDPFPDRPEPNHRFNPKSIPGKTARQQTCDMVSLLDYAVKHYRFRYFLFLEDDFIVCRGGLSLTQKAVQSAAKRPTSITPQVAKAIEQQLLEGSSVPSIKDSLGLSEEVAKSLERLLELPEDEKRELLPFALNQMTLPFALVKVSYGMEGLVYSYIDLVLFAKYIRQNLDRLPVDLLVDAFFFPPTSDPRRYMRMRPAFRYTSILMEHIGKVSTFVERNEANFRPAFPRCLQVISVDGNFKALSAAG